MTVGVLWGSFHTYKDTKNILARAPCMSQMKVWCDFSFHADEIIVLTHFENLLTHSRLLLCSACSRHFFFICGCEIVVTHFENLLTDLLTDSRLD